MKNNETVKIYEVIEYLKEAKLETFSKEYQEGYKDAIKDIKRFINKHMKKNNYEFKDLFDADKSLSQEGKEARAKVSVSQLEQLEKMYPNN